MSYSRTDVVNRERLAHVSMMETLAEFSKVVAKGEATPEQIAFMSEMAKVFDKEKYERVKREVHRRMGSSFDYLSCL